MNMLAEGPVHSRRVTVDAAVAGGVSLEPLESRRMMTVGPVDNDGAVRLETSLGDITLLLSDATPITSANFLRYVRDGRYDDTVFHRSVADFIVQGGGFEVASGYPDIGDFGTIQNEFQQAKAAAGGGKVNVRGTVAMAKLEGNANSASSEFFINVNDNSSNLDNQNSGFTVFARVLGGGLRVADAINNLQTVDATAINPVLGQIPVISSGGHNNPVVVGAARVQQVRPITLDQRTRLVTWVDQNGVVTNISLSGGGRATLTFIAGAGVRVREQGTHVTISGGGVTLEEVTTSQTTKGSTLSISGANGRPQIGSIVVAGGNLGRIDAGGVRLLGDITAANHFISRIDLQSTDRSTITTKGGSLDLSIGTATTTTIQVNGGTLDSFRTRSWVNDGVAAATISAGKINLLDVRGDFTGTIVSGGDVGRIVINGNVGSAGTSSWTIGGNLNDLQARDVTGLTLRVTKTIGRISAATIASDPATANPTTISAGNAIRRIDARHVIAADITGTKAIGTVNVTGTVDSTSIRSDRRIDAVTIGGNLTGKSVASATSTATVLKQSVIYAGVVSTIKSGLVTLPAQFTNKNAFITKVTVGGNFSNTVIAAPTAGGLNLGQVRRFNGTRDFGVVVDKRLARLAATTNPSLRIAVPLVTTQAQVDQYFSNAKITQKDLGDFRVRVV
jgi:cyclophilin family peptidyl-prolyl cis-trans isomerase